MANKKELNNKIPEGLSKERLERRLDLVRVICLGTVMAVVGIGLLVLERPTESLAEKRKLAEKPAFSLSAVLDGSYMRQMTKYYTDTVPYRDLLVDLGASVPEYLGVRVDGVKIHGDIPVVPPVDDKPPVITEPPVTTDAPVTTEPVTEPPVTTEPVTTDTPVTGEPVITDPVTDPVTEPVTEPPVTEPPVTEPPVTEPPVTEPPVTTAPPVTEELPDVNDILRENGIIVLNKRAIMLYYGSYDATARYAASVNEYKKALGDKVNVWSMITPTAVAFYLPDKYSAYTNDQKGHIEYAATLLQGATEINAYAALLPHVKENIYTRTDHHWSTLGAYYATEAFAKKAGVPFAPLSTYKKIEREGYVGTMYAFTGDQVLKNNPETFVYYKPQNDYSVEYFDRNMQNGFASSLFFDWVDTTNSYLVFIGSDDRVTHITTDCKNGRRLFVIKDSYGNALVPFLTGSFEEIWVVDFRYFELNAVQFMKDHEITDFMVSMCAFFSCGTGVGYLESMRTK